MNETKHIVYLVEELTAEVKRQRKVIDKLMMNLSFYESNYGNPNSRGQLAREIVEEVNNSLPLIGE